MSERTGKRAIKPRKVGRLTAKTVPEVRDLITADDAERLKELMQTHAHHKIQEARHKKVQEAARKELYALMLKVGKKDYFDNAATVDGAEVRTEAHVGTKPRSTIDIAKFKKMVTAAIFEKCVTIAVGTAEAEAGKNVVNECKVEGQTEENVDVKVVARI